VTRDHDEEETAGEEAEASSPLARRMADAIADHADRTHAGGDEPPDGDDERAAAGEAGDEAEAPEAPGDGPPLATVLEAVLFAAAEPVPLGRLTRILFPWTRAAVAEALAGLATELAEGTRGVRLVETGSGFQLRSASECAPWIRKFFTEKPPRLSRPMLETVAIVAYRQPVTRGEIESIRGVNCDAVLSALVGRGLVRIVGRRESPGRPLEYGTTPEFLDLFSLRDLSELPPLPDPAALASLIDGDEGEPEESGEPAGADEERRDEAVEREAGAAAEDPEPGGAGVAPHGGGPDPSGPGAGEREGGAGARDEGPPDARPRHD